jgi:hypothetical protein
MTSAGFGDAAHAPDASTAATIAIEALPSSIMDICTACTTD